MTPHTRSRPPAAPTLSERRRRAYLQGFIIIVILAALTALEFYIARTLNGSIPLLFVIGLTKTGLIVQYYMHLSHVWAEEVEE